MVNCVQIILILIREATIISLIQHLRLTFYGNSGLILKTFTHAHTSTDMILSLHPRTQFTGSELPLNQERQLQATDNKKSDCTEYWYTTLMKHAIEQYDRITNRQDLTVNGTDVV